MLKRLQPIQSHCIFAVVPDVVADHNGTMHRWVEYAPTVQRLGYLAAFVAQDGCDVETVPWATVDVLFVGGTTEWKLGQEAVKIVGEAKRRNLWAHMGRVNSYKRLRYARDIGCDSADGTFLKFGPEKNLSRLLGWIDRLDADRQLPIGV